MYLTHDILLHEALSQLTLANLPATRAVYLHPATRDPRWSYTPHFELKYLQISLCKEILLSASCYMLLWTILKAEGYSEDMYPPSSFNDKAT